MKPKQNDQKHQLSVSRQQIYSGPIPDPHSLEMYEQIQPGFADRLISMAEKEQEARLKSQENLIEIERNNSTKELNNFKRGQVFAILSVVMVIALCTYVFNLGFSKEGRDIAISVIIGLAAIFITGRFVKAKPQSNNDHTN